jgi:Cd2+/Zn2+-exporting ATPase
MPHGFVGDMLKADEINFRLLLGTCLIGAILLGVSYISDFLFDYKELSAIISLPSAIMLGAPLVYNALKDLWLNRVEMNELAALSFVVSLGSAQYQVAALIALFLVGSQLIEYRSQLGARKNLEALLKLSPHKASVRRKNGYEEIDVAELAVGDIVRVRPGDRIPGDGTVIDGSSAVDQAAITGEALPVEKGPGDTVFGGTINRTGVIIVRMDVQIQDSTLTKIQNLITQAEKNRTPVTRLINRYVSWYTPIILMCAAIVLFFTHDINRAIAMLIVACPCIIILSTPTAFVAALSSAARLGIIIKNLNILEVANRVNTLIFDKTGTLTTGQLSVTSISVNGRVSEDELLALTASLEQYSTHPVARAVINEATKKSSAALLDVYDINEKPGLGIQGKVSDSNIAVGRRIWIESICPLCPEKDTDIEGTTSLYVAKDNHLIGVIHLADTVRPEAKSVVQDLKKNGVGHIVMLTGDRHASAKRIADQLSCDVESEVMPGQKMERVEEARRRGDVVAMVGDGVNDAPALSAGDVSIAMGAAGSDAAIHSAGIILMNDKLDRIPLILRLSHRVVATIRQNLVFSTLFILGLIVLSAGGAVSPVLAAVLHTSSSLIVVFNSARLLRVGEEIS